MKEKRKFIHWQNPHKPPITWILSHDLQDIAKVKFPFSIIIGYIVVTINQITNPFKVFGTYIFWSGGLWFIISIWIIVAKISNYIKSDGPA